jgi:hypothetical protein
MRDGCKEDVDKVRALRQEYHDPADFLHRPSKAKYSASNHLYAPSFVRPPNVLLRDIIANPVPLDNGCPKSFNNIDGKFTSKSPYSTLLFTSCLFPGKSFGTTFYGRSAT